MEDLISRKEALKALREIYVRGNGLRPATVDMINAIKFLPSAEPEIIRCKDCKYWHREIHNDIEYFNFSSCDLNHYGDGHNFYCADAERKNDG